MNRKNILLLTLVHPDFLPPVYAVAQSLRDEHYNIHILTFDSFVPAQYDLGPNIVLESVGKHYDASTIERLKLRNKFKQRANELMKDDPVSVISFCPFSFHCGLKVKGNKPVIYIALEIADFSLSVFLKSPLSNYRNLSAFKNLHKAALVATPSIQRSAWLAGRCHLDQMPETILNTSYITDNEDPESYRVFTEIVPAEFLDKKIILYTGAVNTEHCIIELIDAFDLANDPQSALMITGVKDNPYCNQVRDLVAASRSKDRILLFPYITRQQMLSLQANAHIGVCLEKEYENNVRSKMIAPNKTGEYMSKNLYILGLVSEYMRPFEMKGIASLAETATKEDISIAILDSIKAVSKEAYKVTIKNFVKDYFSMQYQLKPVIKFLKGLSK
ncbi:MAG: hypothetical protein JWQ38_3502 [Flavipsychrobacter sp.]|nr:hypothetical protein [Flavipsychrobacter sp.]